MKDRHGLHLVPALTPCEPVLVCRTHRDREDLCSRTDIRRARLDAALADMVEEVMDHFAGRDWRR